MIYIFKIELGSWKLTFLDVVDWPGWIKHFWGQMEQMVEGMRTEHLLPACREPECLEVHLMCSRIGSGRRSGADAATINLHLTELKQCRKLNPDSNMFFRFLWTGRTCTMAIDGSTYLRSRGSGAALTVPVWEGVGLVAGVSSTGPKSMLAFDLGVTLRDKHLSAQRSPRLHHPSQEARQGQGRAGPSGRGEIQV